MRHRHLFAALVVAGLPALASAEITPSAELGVVATTGNSDTTSLNGKLGFTGEDAEWTHDYSIAALRAEQDGETTASRLVLAGKSGRKLGDHSTLGASLRYENDDFSAYDYQGTFAINYGYRVRDDEDGKLLFEVGPGVRRSALADGGPVETDAIVRGFADYRRGLTDTTDFFNTFLVEASGDNTFAQNDLGVAVKINGSLALKVSVQARHNTEVAPGVERTDTLSSVALVWSPGQ